MPMRSTTTTCVRLRGGAHPWRTSVSSLVNVRRIGHPAPLSGIMAHTAARHGPAWEAPFLRDPETTSEPLWMAEFTTKRLSCTYIHSYLDSMVEHHHAVVHRCMALLRRTARLTMPRPSVAEGSNSRASNVCIRYHVGREVERRMGLRVYAMGLGGT